MHIHTPLLESRQLSRQIQSTVWLKMEALQPCGSFKTRGIGFACREYVRRGAKRLIASSGGNAGLAVAYCGRQLSIPVLVVVPKSTTERAKALIGLENAELIVKGDTWNEAHSYAMSIVKNDDAYIHPFDDALLWQGHATMIDEICQEKVIPDLIVLSVGGGGLFCGVIEGLQRNHLGNVPILAMETEGAASFHRSLKNGDLVELQKIESIAFSIGAKKIAQQAFDYAQQYNIISRIVSDSQAIDACLQFVDDHRILVEPACGAALAAIYQKLDVLSEFSNIVVIVCGGVGVTTKQLHQWKMELE